MIVQFNSLQLNVQEDSRHEWLLETELVAQGYGVDITNIRYHKRKKSEFIENKHFVTVSNSHGGEPKVFWTKKGVVRLGFFIKSTQAKLFRDWAEDLIIQKMEQPFDSMSLLRNQYQFLGAMIDEMDRTKAVVSDLQVKVAEVEARQITHSSDYFAIPGFAALKKIPISTPVAAKLGKKAKALTEALGYTLGKVYDPRFGTINTYPRVVLEQVFSDFTQ